MENIIKLKFIDNNINSIEINIIIKFFLVIKIPNMEIKNKVIDKNNKLNIYNSITINYYKFLYRYNVKYL